MADIAAFVGFFFLMVLLVPCGTIVALFCIMAAVGIGADKREAADRARKG